MGVGYIRDFWRYRNAIMMPGFDLARRWRVPGGPEGADDEFQTPLDISVDAGDEGSQGRAPLPLDNPDALNDFLTHGQERLPEFARTGASIPCGRV